ncbi:ELWxxDGT repeat protein [Pyxidicoccus sp. 3LG]
MRIHSELVLLGFALGLVVGCTPVHEEEARVADGHSALPRGEKKRWVLCGPEPRPLNGSYPTGMVRGSPSWLVHGPDALFFTIYEQSHGTELWASSGEDPRTGLVKDIRPGLQGSNPRLLTKVGEAVYFVADDGLHGEELWRSDGTAGGAVMVKDIRQGAAGSNIQGLAVWKGMLFFGADDGVHGKELWRSDGTEAGTLLFAELAPGSGGATFHDLAGLGGALYLATSVEHRPVLWRTDGVSPGRLESVFEAFEDYTITNLLPVAGRLVFTVFDGGELDPVARLYRTDGTPGGTESFAWGYLGDVVAVGTQLFFTRDLDPPVGDYELFVSDGTSAGTRLVKDIQPSGRGSDPYPMVAMDGVLYFAADDGVHGEELWRSDGTEEGTVLVVDLEPGAAGSSPRELEAIEGTLFFSANTEARGIEPWVSDGTLTGTLPIQDVAAGENSSSPRYFVRSGWDVFFSADDYTQAHGLSLWAVRFRPAGECD